MAEIVGLVASSLAMVEIVGKVGGGIVRLKRMYDEVENVPTTIQNLLKRLDITFLMLEQMASEVSSSDPGLQDDTAVRRCVLYCESAFNEMAASVDNLLVSIDATKQFKRRRGRFKVALHQNLLAAHERQLGDIVQLLTLAEAASSRAHIKSLPTVLMQHMIQSGLFAVQQQTIVPNETEDHNDNAITTSPPHNAQQIASASKFPKSSSRLPWRGRTFFGSITSAAHTSQIKHGSFACNVKEREFRLQLPWWLTQKAWEMRTSSGWQYTFMTYNIVCADSPIFESVYYDDIEGMLQLFQQGRASPFDMDEFGTTLLDMSSALCRVPMMEVLIQLGSRISLKATYLALLGYSHLGSCSTSSEIRANFRKFDDLMITQGLWDLSKDIPLSSIFRYLGVAGFFDEIVLQRLLPRITPEHYSLPITERLRLLGYSEHTWSHPDVFCRMLWPKRVISESDTLELQSQGCSLLHIIVYYSAGFELLDNLFRCIDTPEQVYRGKSWRRGLYSKDIHSYQESWKDLRFQVITQASDLHFRQDSIFPLASHAEDMIRKPLGTVLSVIHSIARRVFQTSQCRMAGIPPKDYEYMLNTALRSWLNDIHHCSLDLMSYGHTELEMLEVTDRTEISQYCGFRCDERDGDWVEQDDGSHKTRCPRLERFKIGPVPGDWVFYWDWEVEDFAGEFWMAIENPPVCIPGSWVESAEDNLPRDELEVFLQGAMRRWIFPSRTQRQ